MYDQRSRLSRFLLRFEKTVQEPLPTKSHTTQVVWSSVTFNRLHREFHEYQQINSSFKSGRFLLEYVDTYILQMTNYFHLSSQFLGNTPSCLCSTVCCDSNMISTFENPFKKQTVKKGQGTVLDFAHSFTVLSLTVIPENLTFKLYKRLQPQ